jgi:hypothetical protein
MQEGLLGSRRINNYPNYLISPDGIINRLEIITSKGVLLKSRTLIGSSDKKKVYRTISFDGKKRFLIHRLVAEHFLPNPNHFPVVNHKDGNKLNNNVKNLEWCSHQQNNFHARHIIKTNKGPPARFGKDHHGSKKINQLSLNNEFIKTWDNATEASKELKIKRSAIGNNLKKRSKTSGGFKWEFAK